VTTERFSTADRLLAWTSAVIEEIERKVETRGRGRDPDVLNLLMFTMGLCLANEHPEYGRALYFWERAAAVVAEDDPAWLVLMEVVPVELVLAETAARLEEGADAADSGE